jgi:hypothetical protein
LASELIENSLKVQHFNESIRKTLMIAFDNFALLINCLCEISIEHQLLIQELQNLLGKNGEKLLGGLFQEDSFALENYYQKVTNRK